MRARIAALFVTVALLIAPSADAQSGGRKRALLIGINDYNVSSISPRKVKAEAAPGRDWPNLNGAVTDVHAMAEMLVLLYGFDRRDIITLTDQRATRAAILQTLAQQIVDKSAKGDVVLFYFAGHGSQVRNSLSDEPDKLDESLVPADSRAGARDIRDKELRPLFNRILDRGPRLTVILDNCFSGSGARGLGTTLRPRGVKADSRDVADRTNGPRPENRGALVLSASLDYEKAWETRDPKGNFHGAFTWALMRAMRDASPGEAAVETFQRAQARLRGEMPFQDPVLGGDDAARLNPLFGVRNDRLANRAVIAVERVRSDGTVLLQGGWANGLDVGSELRVLGEPRITTQLVITAIEGLGRSEARIQTSGRTMPQAVKPGALLEIAGWVAPPARPLRVWMPRVAASAEAITDLARAMAAEAVARGVKWIADPLKAPAAYFLRRNGNAWELLGPNNTIEPIGSDDNAVAAVAKLSPGSSLFVQFPAPAGVVNNISVGPGTDREAIVPVDRAEEADYVLVGRYASSRLTYAWVRPHVKHADRKKTGLPVRTAWTPPSGSDVLRDAVLRLRRIQSWQQLESPPDARWAYGLGLKRSKDGEFVPREGVAVADEQYSVSLRLASPAPKNIGGRFVYVFVIDSDGKSTVLFPQNTGSVENRFPLSLPAPREIPLGSASAFEISPPFGVDTYFLLTTDEPLPNPAILEWEGVRGAGADATTALEELLLETGSASRGVLIATPSNWSIERFVCESVRSRTSRKEDAPARRHKVPAAVSPEATSPVR